MRASRSTSCADGRTRRSWRPAQHRVEAVAHDASVTFEWPEPIGDGDEPARAEPGRVERLLDGAAYQQRRAA